ncbi:hypothetical protein B224_0587 [Aeromonas media WS]|nr:hypothetical protein B224_0587 [Aeromonas media WS]
MVPSWRDQARGNSGSRDDRLTFSCQCHLGEQLRSDFYRILHINLDSRSLATLKLIRLITVIR